MVYYINNNKVFVIDISLLHKHELSLYKLISLLAYFKEIKKKFT